MKYLALFVVLLAASNSLAQDVPAKPKTEAPPPNPCPQIEMRAPQQRAIRDGEQVGYSLAMSGGDPAVVPTFVWTTSAGVIVNGQGTRNIRVDTTGAGNDRQIRTEVWVGGYAPQCVATASFVLQIAAPAVKVGEMPTTLTTEEEADGLKNFSDVILSSNDNAYVFGYAGRRSERGFANTVLKRIKAQLLANGIPYERLALIDGGYREEPAVELWVVPVGAEAPRPKPTVNAKEIIFPKPAPAKKP